MRLRRRARDPQLPKGVRTRLAALERAIIKLNDAYDLDSSERSKALRKIQAAIWRFEEYGRREGVPATADLGQRLWRDGITANEQAERNYRMHLQNESSRLRREEHERRMAHVDPATRAYLEELKRGRDRRRRRKARRR
jgi:hypothetical protein